MDSYGYRPGKSAHDALEETRRRCWRYDWVLEFDIKGLFDNIDWYKEDAEMLVGMLQEHFQKFGLDLHPDKTRVISFGKYEQQNADKQNRRANTFTFLGITHYCDTNRWGGFVVGRTTSNKRFRAKCKDFTDWIKESRNRCSLATLWENAGSKLRGHFLYYGISGNFRSIKIFYFSAMRSLFKWLIRRSQRNSWNRFEFWQMVKRHPLPMPKIAHNLYSMPGVQ